MYCKYSVTIYSPVLGNFSLVFTGFVDLLYLLHLDRRCSKGEKTPLFLTIKYRFITLTDIKCRESVSRSTLLPNQTVIIPFNFYS